jgi:hypothetical protein
MGRAIAKAAYNSLLDPQTGEVKLKPKTAREAADLLKLGIEIEFESLDLKEKLPKESCSQEATDGSTLTDEELKILAHAFADAKLEELKAHKEPPQKLPIP